MAGQRPTSRPLDSATYNKLVGLAYRQQQTDAALYISVARRYTHLSGASFRNLFYSAAKLIRTTIYSADAADTGCARSVISLATWNRSTS